MKRPVALNFLILFLTLLSFNAFYGGGSMIIAADGSLLGLNIEWISDTPFSDFTIPGILLLIFLGIVPAISLIGLFWKKSNKFFDKLNIYPDKYWGWTFSLYSGVISIVWIVAQQLLTDYFILQPIICANGLLIIVFALMPGVQKYYAISDCSYYVMQT